MERAVSEPKKESKNPKSEGSSEERDRFEEAMRAIFSVPQKPKGDSKKKSGGRTSESSGGQ